MMLVLFEYVSVYSVALSCPDALPLLTSHLIDLRFACKLLEHVIAVW
jgi:hypothetical protein